MKPSKPNFPEERPASPKTVTKHPTFGVIDVNRDCSGRDELFGASDRVGASVSLTISTATLEHYHDDHKVHIWPDRRIVEVQMTKLQFAQMMTGTGTPCTIVWSGGAFTKPPGQITTRRQQIEEDFRREMCKAGENCDRILAMARELMEKPNINKSDRQKFVDLAREMASFITSRQPWIASRFTHFVETVLAETKADKDPQPVSPPSPDPVRKAGEPSNTLSVEECAQQFEMYAHSSSPDKCQAYAHAAKFLREFCKSHDPKDLRE